MLRQRNVRERSIAVDAEEARAKYDSGVRELTLAKFASTAACKRAIGHGTRLAGLRGGPWRVRQVWLDRYRTGAIAQCLARRGVCYGIREFKPAEKTLFVAICAALPA